MEGDLGGEGRVLELEGRRIVLRAILEDDAGQFQKFTNELVREKTTNPALFIVAPEGELSGSEAEEAVRRMRRAEESGDMVSIGAFEGPNLVGSCEIFRPRADELRHTGLLDIAILSGNRSIGLGEQMVKEVLARAKRSGIWIVELRVFATNVPAIRLYEKMGFRRSGLVPNMIRKDGRYIDDVQMYIDLRDKT